MAGLFMAQGASAVLYDFYKIPSSGGASQDLHGQLTVDVTGKTEGTKEFVTFLFKNNVGIASSITDIYFDGEYFKVRSLPVLIASDGVRFEVGASPPNLPGGNTLDPKFKADFGLQSRSGPPGTSANGINTKDEFLSATYELKSGFDLDKILASLDKGDLRIGLHVQSIGTGSKSDSYVNTPLSVKVPDSGAMLVMLGAGLLAMGLLARRTSRTA